MKKKLAILGSTGSIGTSTLTVVKHLKEQFEIVALAAHKNIDLLAQQAHEFQPEFVAVYDKSKAMELKQRCPHLRVEAGIEGIKAAAAYHSVDQVVSAMSGTLGLIPTVTALEAGKNVALANKEALVSGGSLVMSLVREKGVQLLPIDSEHSAIFQCLHGEKIETVSRIVLTSSGGPFRNLSDFDLKSVTVDHALQHPTWNMGKKVTIDSSTLMNKGLEVIEAYWLFGLPLDKIEVVIHPQSIIHSLVEYVDGSMLAQMSIPNMILPIQYALTYPNRRPGILKPFDFVKNGKLEFYQPDTSRFRCLDLAYYAIREGGSLPCFMNAANEILVNRFLERQIAWEDIGKKLETLMNRHRASGIDSLDDLLAIDDEARLAAESE